MMTTSYRIARSWLYDSDPSNGEVRIEMFSSKVFLLRDYSMVVISTDIGYSWTVY